jgi:glycosyltransferase involved in cell wall biosynthesis
MQPRQSDTSPRVSVLIPAFNRPAEVQRALESVRRQTFADFECLLVDDCSTEPIEPIVRELDDERFRYLRTPVNGGPYAARHFGFRAVRGEYVFGLDSDDEAYPWAIAQAVSHLDAEPRAAGVAGLFVAHDGSRLFLRVGGGTRLVTPDQYVSQPPLPDAVAVVRRLVIEEWLRKRPDYYALESHAWLTFSLRHAQLYVDEPWVLKHWEGGGRVTNARDPRSLDDFVKFREDHGHLMDRPCVVLDVILASGFVDLLRAGRRREALRYARLLRRRGGSPLRAITDRAAAKLRRRIPLGGDTVGRI